MLKRILSVLAFLLVGSVAWAQNDPFIRNDAATTTIVGSNLTTGKAAISSLGQQFTISEGGAGHGQTAVSDPVIVGSVAATSNPGGFTAGLAMQFLIDIFGRQVTAPYALVGRSVSGVTASDITDTTSTSIIAAQGASVRTYLTNVIITNSDATVGTDVIVLDGATRRLVCTAAANNGGCSVALPFALRGTANTAWNCQPVTTSAQVNCTFVGYTAVD
jgi:hypothetical protein